MTLAIILFLCVAYSAPAALPAHLIPFAQQGSQNQAGESAQGRNAGTEGQTQGPPAQTPSSAGKQKRATSKQRKHAKKATTGAQVECPPVNSVNSAAPANAPGADTSPSANSSNDTASNQTASSQTPSNQAAPTPAASDDAPSNNARSNADAAKAAPSGNTSAPNCPPSKTVVTDGGTTESSIQLIGGKGADQASQQRSTTDQLLVSTEDNLKRVAGRQLNTSQQEMVNQIRQFIEQSRAAVSAGDMARGHNLALKAHLLSDELVKP